MLINITQYYLCNYTVTIKQLKNAVKRLSCNKEDFKSFFCCNKSIFSDIFPQLNGHFLCKTESKLHLNRSQHQSVGETEQ